LAGGSRDYTVGFAGRTYSSPCASHGTYLFLTDDDGTFLVEPMSAPEAVPGPPATVSEDIVARYSAARTRLSDNRLNVPMVAPATLPSNQWSLNKAGSTLFVPVTDITEEYINLLLMMLDPDNGLYIYDDMNANAEPLARFVGPGRLDRGRALPLSAFEADVVQCTASTEQALMLQNVFLTTQAIGLGGWLLSPSDPYAVFGGTPDSPGLGFRFEPVRAPNSIPDFEVRRSVPVGLDDHIEPLCPPYVHDFDQAVHTVQQHKWRPDGAYRTQAPPALRDQLLRQPGVSTPQWTIDAAVTLCRYVYATYGRFPAKVAPVQMSTWFQAHHLDAEYYQQHYPDHHLPTEIVEHLGRWHR